MSVILAALLVAAPTGNLQFIAKYEQGTIYLDRDSVIHTRPLHLADMVDVLDPNPRFVRQTEHRAVNCLRGEFRVNSTTTVMLDKHGKQFTVEDPTVKPTKRATGWDEKWLRTACAS